METPGGRNMGFGLLWFAGGSVVTLATYNAASGGGTYVVAYGAIVAGAIQFLIGLFEFIGSRTRRNESNAAGPSREFVALVRAMASMASADGKISRDELMMMQAIIAKVTDSQVDLSVIEKLAASANDDKQDVVAYLRAHSQYLDIGVQEVILRGVGLMMKADGNVAHEEVVMLRAIADAMRMPADRIAAVLTEFVPDLSTSPEGTVAAPQPG